MELRKLFRIYVFTFSQPEVGILFPRFSFFSRPEVRKLLLFYVFTFSRPEVRKLFRIYVFTFSRPEVGILFRIYVFTFSRPARLQQLQWISNGVTAVLHKAIDFLFFYFFPTYFFTFSQPQVGKLFHIYVRSFSRPEVEKLFLIYFFTFSWPEVGKLFHIYFFTFSQTEVGKLLLIYLFTFSRKSSLIYPFKEIIVFLVCQFQSMGICNRYGKLFKMLLSVWPMTWTRPDALTSEPGGAPGFHSCCGQHKLNRIILWELLPSIDEYNEWSFCAVVTFSSHTTWISGAKTSRKSVYCKVRFTRTTAI